MKRLEKMGARPPAIICALLCTLGSTATPAPVSTAKGEAEADFAAQLLSASGDAAIKERIYSALRKPQSGARAYLLGRQVLELDNKAVLDRAQQANLDIQTRQRDRSIAGYIHEETKAPFDPVLSLSGSFQVIDSYERSAFINRERLLPITLDGTPITPDNFGAPVGDNPSLNSTPDTQVRRNFSDFVCVTIDNLLVNPEQCALRTELRGETERASSNARLLNAWQMTAGVSKLFSWGSLFALQFQSSRRLKSFYPLDSFGIDQQLSQDDPIGRGSSFPWTASLQTLFTSPLPYSRNFGAYGTTANVGLLVAETAERQADWTVKATVNSTLREVDSSYWDLVRNFRLTQIAAQQRETLEALSARSERLYRDNRITTYDLSQIQSDLENSRNLEEITWNDFISASNRLVELLNYPHASLIVPVGYAPALTAIVAVDPGEAVATAVVQRPEIRVSQMALEQREILFNFSRTQTRPDLALTLSLNLSQNDRVLGYDSWDSSVGNVFNPDTTDFFVGVSFRIPLGNRAVKSQLDQARVFREQARDRVENAENLVVQDVNQVVTDVYSTEAQAAQTRVNLNLAQLAYDKALGLRDQALVTDFELLRKLNELLNARSAHLTALVNHRKTRARLLAAKGVLATQY